MGEARRRKQAGNTEPNPNYQRRKRVRKSDLSLFPVPDIRAVTALGLLAASYTKRGLKRRQY